MLNNNVSRTERNIQLWFSTFAGRDEDLWPTIGFKPAIPSLSMSGHQLQSITEALL